MQIAIVGSGRVGQASPPRQLVTGTRLRSAHGTPLTAISGVLDDVGDAPDGKILFDTCNRANPAELATGLDGTSVAAQIQVRVPAAKAVNAFNTAPLPTTPTPRGREQRTRTRVLSRCV
jgi:predicted dinucleotide-binding enzyme